MKKILSAFGLPDEIIESYKDSFVIDCPAYGHFYSDEELIERLPGADAFLGISLNKDMIDAAKKLQIASSFGAGYDGLNYKYAGEKGIWVMNSPNATTQPTAELTIALLLCLTRRLINFQKLMIKRRVCSGVSLFVDPFDDAPAPTPAHGKTLGIVGLGKIGKEVAKRAVGLNMKVIYYDVCRAPEAVEQELGVTFVPFDALLKTADYVTLHCMYTPENHHMMSAEQFKMMKPSAYFINAGRGKLMNEQALVNALKNKEILGAAIDVFEFEPEVNQELFDMDNVIITPHIGTTTRQSRLCMAKEALDGIKAHLTGGTSPTIVNQNFFKAK